MHIMLTTCDSGRILTLCYDVRTRTLITAQHYVTETEPTRSRSTVTVLLRYNVRVGTFNAMLSCQASNRSVAPRVLTLW